MDLFPVNRIRRQKFESSLTTGRKYDLYLKFECFKKEEVRNEGHYEKNVPTKQCKAKKDSWLYGKDEHKGRAQCVETEEIEGKKKVDRLITQNS